MLVITAAQVYVVVTYLTWREVMKMFRDFKCTKKGCKGQLIDHQMDILAEWPKCPKCGSEMQDISFKTAKVAIRGKGYSKETIR